jgi:hypothetical protein
MAKATVESTRPASQAEGFWSTFSLETWRGWLAVGSLVVFLFTPTLTYFVSLWFIFLLPVAWAMSITSHFAGHMANPGLTRTQRLVRAGQAVALNGVTLIVAMFFVGFLADFITNSEAHAELVGAGFSSVHVLFGTGLVLQEMRHD